MKEIRQTSQADEAFLAQRAEKARQNANKKLTDTFKPVYAPEVIEENPFKNTSRPQ